MPRMTGAQCFAEMMQGYDVSHIFFVPAFMLKAFAEMEDRPIRRVMVHGEKAAAYMADGYARASGKPGVCMAQMIGASNLAAGLRDGFMAGAPIIAITGGPTPQSRHRHAYQEVDDITQFDTVTKFNAQIDHVTRMPDLLRQAFRVATSGAPGPVHLRVQSHLGQITEEEAELDPLVEAAYRCAPAFRPEPEMEHVRQALVVLSKAERPVIVAGGGVVRSGAQAELVELAEKLSVPVATSLNAKAAIVEGHPLAVGVPGAYSRDCANRALSEADLVFFIGSHAGGQVTNNWMFPRLGTKVIQLDIDPQELGRNYPNTVSILGDAKVALRQDDRGGAGAHRHRGGMAATGAATDRRMARRARADAPFGCTADPARAHLQGDLRRVAARWRRRLGHRPRRHLDRRAWSISSIRDRATSAPPDRSAGASRRRSA